MENKKQNQIVKKLTKDELLTIIAEQAIVYKKKEKLYEDVKKIKAELKVLYEDRGIAGTYGFASPTDTLNKTKSGFVNPQEISHLDALEKEFGCEGEQEGIAAVVEPTGEGNTEDLSAKLEKLEKENKLLQAELENLRLKKELKTV